MIPLKDSFLDELIKLPGWGIDSKESHSELWEFFLFTALVALRI